MKGAVRYGLEPPIRKAQITLSMDDVLEWFRGKGKRYQTEMNALIMSLCRGQT